MVDLLRDGFDVVLGDVFALEFFVGEFDVDFVGEVGDDELFFGESEVLGGVVEEGILVADDFAVEGVDDGVGLVEEDEVVADFLVQLLYVYACLPSMLRSSSTASLICLARLSSLVSALCSM